MTLNLEEDPLRHDTATLSIHPRAIHSRFGVKQSSTTTVKTRAKQHHIPMKVSVLHSKLTTTHTSEIKSYNPSELWESGLAAAKRFKMTKSFVRLHKSSGVNFFNPAQTLSMIVRPSCNVLNTIIETSRHWLLPQYKIVQRGCIPKLLLSLHSCHI